MPPLRAVIRAHGLTAAKRFGQHFILDPSILQRVAEAAGPLEGLHVLEVGPGPGGLTRALLSTGATSVTVVEQDRRFLPPLEELRAFAGDRLTILEGDARAVPLADVAAAEPIAIVANLPYNIGTELLLRWLTQLEHVRVMVLMFQKEVAERLRAHPGQPHWGRLGVLASTLCSVELLFDLPPAAFVPPPKVSSSVVRLVPKARRPDDAFMARLEKLTGAAFGQRRKMLRSSLKGIVERPETFLAGNAIDPTRRGETLTLEELHRLADRLPPQ